MEELNGVSYICGAHFHLCFMLWGAKIKTDPVPSPQASLVAQMVKNLSAMQETRVQSLGQEDPLENRMATHLVFLLGEFHGKTNLVGYSSWGCRVRRD